MHWAASRRAVLAAAVGGGVAGGFLTGANWYLDTFAPLSGEAWRSARAGRQSTVESPYGEAELRYDEDGVPGISADDERALYFAVGYAQGTDRLFQLDLQRRLFSGRLSEVVGEQTVDSDIFHRQLYFREAAQATAEHLRETADDTFLEAADAFAEGVSEAIERESLPLEFHLLEYEPEPWTLTDTLLIEKIIAWGLTGSFRTLRKALIREEFGETLAEQLYPTRFDDVTPIIRNHHDAGPFGEDLEAGEPDGMTVSKELVEWLAQFEPADTLGSNSWLVDAELAAGDAPLLSNDPHLQLQAPPIWYEMHVDGPNHRVRGVTFPGVPFVVIGENDHGAWGFTNANADVINFYTYEEDESGDEYRYGDEYREYDTETVDIEVAGGSTETIERKRTVHGPVIEEADQEVAVAWTGMAATETSIAVYELTHSEDVDDALAAIEKFEVPTQNVLYADRDGGTLYKMSGRIPLRMTDGEPTRGDVIFDGSEPEGEWPGFQPFERPTWEGFVPFEANPGVENPSYIATANQQIVPDEDLGYYLAAGYSSPYRGERIYELLDRRIEAGEAIDLDTVAEIGRDTFDGRAEALVEPIVAAARASEEDALQDAADRLTAWDYRMEAGSEAALLFQVWTNEYRDAIFETPFDEVDIGEELYPADGAIERLPPDSGWFGPGGRAQVMRRALRAALATIDDEGYETYGDLANTGVIEHPLGLDFLGYPAYSRGGTGDTVWNFSHRGPWGGGWAMHVDLDGEYRGLLAGGNSGRYFSTHYDDQIERWAKSDFRTLSRNIEGELVTTFEEGGE